MINLRQSTVRYANRFAMGENAEPKANAGGVETEVSAMLVAGGVGAWVGSHPCIYCFIDSLLRLFA